MNQIVILVFILILVLLLLLLLLLFLRFRRVFPKRTLFLVDLPRYGEHNLLNLLVTLIALVTADL